MENVTPPETGSPAKPRARGCLLWLGGLVIALLVLLLLGAWYESTAEAADKRAYPPPGQLIDVGGYRLHLHCEGTGSPTVVIDAGLGDWSATWNSWVQPEVAKTTRVCAYDRAGLGYSDPGPLPRTTDHFVEELHTLLQQARIAGPYVLVGHSAGGLTVRLYAQAYAEDVVGVVLVDSMNPRPAQASDPVIAPLPDGPPSALSFDTFPARIGLLRLLSGPLALKEDLSPDVADRYVAFSVTPRHLQTIQDESQGLAESLAQARAVASLGDLPLIVLSRGLNPEAEWQTLQSDLLRLSSHSEHVIADQSGHLIQLEQPEAVVAAIVQVVTQSRLSAAP